MGKRINFKAQKIPIVKLKWWDGMKPLYSIKKRSFN